MVLVTTPTPFRSIVRIEQPRVEPVSVFEAKQHLRNDADMADDDELLAGLISAARVAVESRLGMTLTATRWRAKLGPWSSCSCRGYDVPYPPLLVDDDHPVEITYKDHDGTTITVPADEIAADPTEVPGRIQVSHSLSGPCCETNATITWWGGVIVPSQVPAPIRAAILRIVGALYTRRGDTAEAIITADPGVDAMLASCSIFGRY